MEEELLDCVVVGLGAHGSSCIAKLAKENAKVLGLEKFTRVHSHGSSHGKSRIIRQAYFEDPRYVPLVKRSFELWRELADFEAKQRIKESCQDVDSPSLLNVCGGLMIGSEESMVITGTLEAARVHQLPHEILTAQEITARYPVLTPGEDMVGVFETEAGYLIPEACIEAHCQMAEQHGARLCFEESLVSWCVVRREGDSEGEGDREELLSVVTDRHNTYLTKKLVLAVGAWAPELYGSQIPVPLRVERRVLFWFRPSVSEEDAGGFRDIPVFLWDNSTKGNMCQFYGFPSERSGTLAHCVKMARHQTSGSTLPCSDMGKDEKDNIPFSALCTPDSIDRRVCSPEIEYMQQVLRGKVPSLASGSIEAVDTCMYTITPDEHFLIDFHPDNNNVILASPCSGHGFKFSSVIGEILKDLVIHGESTHDISLFSISSRIST